MAACGALTPPADPLGKWRMTTTRLSTGSRPWPRPLPMAPAIACVLPNIDSQTTTARMATSPVLAGHLKRAHAKDASSE